MDAFLNLYGHHVQCTVVSSTREFTTYCVVNSNMAMHVLENTRTVCQLHYQDFKLLQVRACYEMVLLHLQGGLVATLVAEQHQSLFSALLLSGPALDTIPAYGSYYHSFLVSIHLHFLFMT